MYQKAPQIPTGIFICRCENANGAFMRSLVAMSLAPRLRHMCNEIFASENPESNAAHRVASMIPFERARVVVYNPATPKIN
jgi:hypothetical protein